MFKTSDQNKILSICSCSKLKFCYFYVKKAQFIFQQTIAVSFAKSHVGRFFTRDIVLTTICTPILCARTQAKNDNIF
ncbi:MAG: hypothetical protein DYG99_12845 [Bacteroidetes bacterium CHB5]|nr:hypothetical protein [Bacteroidetes bacterium CHB5]